ncbi:MAG: RNA-binding S4 domain-containing protein [Pseudomonadota bacterium]
MRVDKWLWQARFFKTRSLASKIVAEGKVRVNAQPISKPSRSLALGDVLTFPQGHAVRVIKVLDFGVRRGPAPEAQALYEDLSPPVAAPPLPADRTPGQERMGGRPTKRDRRSIDRLEGRGPHN